LSLTVVNILLVLAIDAIVALVIAMRQRREGYSFTPAFIKAMIGLIGVSAIVWKFFLS